MKFSVVLGASSSNSSTRIVPLFVSITAVRFAMLSPQVEFPAKAQSRKERRRVAKKGAKSQRKAFSSSPSFFLLRLCAFAGKDSYVANNELFNCQRDAVFAV